MRIVAHLGVKDEAELIEQTIAHLRAIGVDLIIAVDSFSTDGTAELLEAHCHESDFRLIQMSDLEPDGPERTWLAKNLDLVQQVDADWAIFLDADEFWIPASGSLKACPALADHDLLSVDRFNIALGTNGPAMPDELIPKRYGELLLYVKPVPDLRAGLRTDRGTPWIRGVPVSKVMVRAGRIRELTDGMHDAVAIGDEPLRRTNPPDLLIAHLPFTTRDRFRRKVANASKIVAAHDEYLGEHLAWHWRRWVALAGEGRIDEEFELQRSSIEALAQMRAAGVVCSAAEVFAEREPRMSA